MKPAKYKDEFQSLIGRLITIYSVLYICMATQFQSLIGRLITIYIVRRHKHGILKFQSLIGRLITASIQLRIEDEKKVSIPYR